MTFVGKSDREFDDVGWVSRESDSRPVKSGLRVLNGEASTLPVGRSLKQAFREGSTKSLEYSPHLISQLSQLYFNIINSLQKDNSPLIVQFVPIDEDRYASQAVRQFATYANCISKEKVLLIDRAFSKCDVSRELNGAAAPHRTESILDDDDDDDGLFTFRPPNNGQLYNHSRSVWLEVYNQARQNFAMTVVNSPPITTNPEGVAWSGFVDGIVLMLTPRRTLATRVSSALRVLDNMGARGRILGILMNKSGP
jgi:hypothetical protein